MDQIETKILNCDAVKEAEKNMVFVARLTQRGHTIHNMDDLYDLSPVLFCPAMTGPFCQRDKCLEGKMSCGVSISRTMTPARILLTDYPGLSGGIKA